MGKERREGEEWHHKNELALRTFCVSCTALSGHLTHANSFILITMAWDTSPVYKWRNRGAEKLSNLFRAMVKQDFDPGSKSVAQSCLTLYNPMDCSPPDSSVHGILQARILEWVAISSSRGIFLTQASNLYLLGLLHWQVDSLQPCHLETYTSFQICQF